MLITNADDFGRSRLATDSIVACFAQGSLTSASAMVFMDDSERAAGLALANGVDVGLHLNFTEPFTKSTIVGVSQRRIAKVLRCNRYASLLYYPSLRQAFQDVVTAQSDEFARLYGSAPARFDGHHHMHLCLNVVLDGIIPRGSKVRRNFSFLRREKSPVNRLYRAVIDRCLLSRYRCTDYLFSLSSALRSGTLDHIRESARYRAVELQTHPENQDEYEWLLSPSYQEAFSMVEKSSFAVL